MTKKTVIYGGAFSPPHVGHAIALENIIRNFQCDEIWIMPSGERHDKKISSDGFHRKEMISLMIADLFRFVSGPRLSISTLELEHLELTTTFETKNILERNHPESEFYFAIGADIVKDIEPRWVHGKELFNSAKFLVLKKFGYSIPENLPQNFKVIENSINGTDISSTFIRGVLADGHSGVPYLTPAVAAYIDKNNLYR